jgi:hypothetical protein
MKTERSIYILYSQIAVFQDDLESPFNDWSPAHVLQGFSWRPQSVSFGTLEEDGDLRVTVDIRETLDTINKQAIRAIRVPFTVRGITEIASISDGFKIQVPDGDYSLYFETGKDMDGMWSLLTFVKEYDPEPEILLCDDQLKPGKTLLMTANPAT